MAGNTRRHTDRGKTMITRPMTSVALKDKPSAGYGYDFRDRSVREHTDRCKSAPDKYRVAKPTSATRKPRVVSSRRTGWTQQAAEPTVIELPKKPSITELLESFDEDYDFDKWSDDEFDTDPAQECKRTYEASCRNLKIVPVESFCRQLVREDREINLSNKLMTPMDVKAVAITLINTAIVQRLDLSGNNLGPTGAGYVAQVLRENSFIAEVDLSSTNPGVDGLTALCTVIKTSRSLKELRLSGNQFDIGHASALADIISNNDYLQRLDLSYNKLGDDGGQILGPAIGENVGLQELNLKWNHLRMRGAIAVARAIESNSRLEKVDLSWNGLGLEGCCAMATALAVNQTLVELNMECNRVDLTCLEKLMEGVTKNDNLQVIKLGLNPLTSDGAIFVLNKLNESKSCGIKELDLADVPVDNKFQDLLAEMQSLRRLAVKHGKPFRVTDIRQEQDNNHFQNYDPLMIMYQYMREDNLRLIDVFHSFDVNRDDSISRDEFRDGFLAVNIPITEHALDVLLKKLDINADGKVDFSELGDGHRHIRRKVSSLMHKMRESKMIDPTLHSSKDNPYSKLQGLVKDAVNSKRSPRRPPLVNPWEKDNSKTNTLKVPVVPEQTEFGESSGYNSRETAHSNEIRDGVQETDEDIVELANNLRKLFQKHSAGQTLKLVFKATSAFNQSGVLKSLTPGHDA